MISAFWAMLWGHVRLTVSANPMRSKEAEASGKVPVTSIESVSVILTWNDHADMLFGISLFDSVP